MSRHASMIALTLLSLPALAATNPAKVADVQTPPLSESARTVQYDAQDIVAIHAKLKYTTLIVVPPTEKIMEAATGDKDFWVVGVVGNFCFVHPARHRQRASRDHRQQRGNGYPLRGKGSDRGRKAGVHLIRYADDFIITGKTKELLNEEVKPLVERLTQCRNTGVTPECTSS